MNNKLKIILTLFTIAVAGVFSVFLIFDNTIISINNNEVENDVLENEISPPADEKEINEDIIEPEVAEEVLPNLPEAEDMPVEMEEDTISTSTHEAANILFNVPFTPQAPFAEWNDPIHQDGCEEAVSLMAVYWATGKKLSPAISKEIIVAASDFQKEEYGEYRDTSAEVTAERIIKGYFNYENYEVKKEITIKDIISELKKGNIIILPMDGQALKNPYFTPPGPERHMVVVVGYNEEKKEFITNDPGTRRGESFFYPEERLYSAIRDYSSGYHIPIEKIEKTMIVVMPE